MNIEKAKIDSISSIVAGFFIAVCYLIYLKIGGALGSILFCLGLSSILVLELKLFTGAIGGITSVKDLRDYGRILFWNVAGVCVGALVCCSADSEFYNLIYNMGQAKLNRSWFSIWSSSVLCGTFIQLAVDLFKEKKHDGAPLVFLCVLNFLLAGFDHCVINSIFFLFDLRNINTFFLFVDTVLGNAFGAIVLGVCTRAIRNSKNRIETQEKK